jgi:hypothetical protein
MGKRFVRCVIMALALPFVPALAGRPIVLHAAASAAGTLEAFAPAQDEAPAVQGRRARPGAARGDGQAVSTLPTAELVTMLDTYAIVQAQQALALDDEHYGRFVTRLKRLQEVRRRNQRDRNQILQALRRLTAPQAGSVDEAAVRDRLRALREQDDRAAAELRKAEDAVDEVLTVRQQARFRLFEETIERRKLDLLVRARERAARAGRE